MSALLVKRSISTVDDIKPNIIASGILFDSSRTSTSRETINRNLVAALERTTSGVAIASISSPEATQKALSELRRLSGLTWDQLAKLFNVSRRSLHFWASGQPLSRFNEEHLNRLLGTIRYIDRGSASLNRSLLLRPDSDGNPLLDLLVAAKYEEFKGIVGSNNAPRRPLLGALSKDAHKAYMPQNPADLVDALQEPIHREVGRARPARTARSRKNSSGQ
ncbi:XRE family transcriptional regulator [Synechocystis salina LEGE 06099]|uniref:XRE family transcriptional regulator n=1 Tax=Synechocystis salina TaxID=945780 RepID=UPI001880ACF8|nr:XRE family transcriptional regulator [Synechocystis salina]MBE9204878.1 XRE family transcriptional regulator [Synechocystis salina LEGE 06099]